MSSGFSRRFFHRLWRFNAVVIAAVAVMGLAYGALAGFYIARDVFGTRNVSSIAPVAPVTQDHGRQGEGQQPALETLGFSRLPDAQFMWAAMTSVDRMSQSYYSKEATNTRDYVFYDMQTGAFRRLLGRDDRLIAQMTFLAPPAAETTMAIAHKAVAVDDKPVAILVSIVERDSDGDGRLSGKDLKSVAMSGPSGLGLTTIASGVQALIGQTVAADGSAIVMIKDKDGLTRGLKISVPDFAVLRDDAFQHGAGAPG